MEYLRKKREGCMGCHTSILEKAKRALCGDISYLAMRVAE